MLIDRAVAEWVSYYRYAWDTHKQQWYAITTSGRRLPFEKMQQTKGYYSARKWDPQPTNGTVLWLAALAARLKPSVETQRILASQLEAMKLGRLSNGKALLAETTDTMDERVIYALLEMHRRHPDEGLLSFGDAIARNILQRGRIGKLFVPAQDRIWASINTPVPLALLHLEARKKNLPPNSKWSAKI